MTQITEHLKIRGFAGIMHLDLDVGPFTVLIGPQSVGKSIVAKLLYFFRSIPRTLYLEAFKDEPCPASETLLEQFAKILPSPTHAGGLAEILYTSGRLRFSLRHSGKAKASWEVSFPKELERAFNRLAEDLVADETEEESVAEATFSSRVKKLWPGADVQPRFVPAGRSFYAQIERDAASFFETASLDPFVTEFAKFLARLKGRQRLRQTLPAAEAATELGRQLLSGYYQREGNEDFINSIDGRKLPLRLWSSGQQEAQPLTLLLQRYCAGHFFPTCLFIEEPEAHLFPESQKLMTEFIALAFRARQPGMQIFVTTHSPYILTTINNLMLAGQLYDRKLRLRARAELRKMVPEDRALPPGSVGAYYMNRESCRAILDTETGLIGSSEIDAVSGCLNEQFDTLLGLDRT